MKKVLLTAIAVFVFGFSNAQEEESNGFSKGNVMLSGGFGIVSQSQDEEKFTGLYIRPKAGYFVSNNIVVGLSLGLSNTKEENGALNPIVKRSQTSIGAFGRYYFTPANKFSFFGELDFNVLSSKTTFINPLPTSSIETKANGFNVGLSPGVSYFISKNFALETSIGLLGYQTEKQDVPGAKSLSSVNFGVDISSITLGLVYKF
ncbi:outer membrane beta-barrel protein [Flavobacterium sp.]|uniref:outer membrane beta-barrel protein n=1 Tax=Flavobacterium sp. TaxID=239 RepID=UPI00286DFA1C|nr:outer membrane beta-barrel protein [Flavobacterium sp.]